MTARKSAVQGRTYHVHRDYLPMKAGAGRPMRGMTHWLPRVIAEAQRRHVKATLLAKYGTPRG